MFFVFNFLISFRYVLLFENLLRTIDCRITVPYWNWARHYSRAWSVTPNYHMWDADGGFGGNGDPSRGYCVTNGPFSFTKYKSIIGLRSLNERRYVAEKNCEKYIKTGIRCPFNNYIFQNFGWKFDYAKCYFSYLDRRFTSCLRRSFQWYPPSLRAIQSLIEVSSPENWHEFDFILMNHLHDRVHLNVGKSLSAIYLFIYLFIFLFIYLFIYLSICLYIFCGCV